LAKTHHFKPRSFKIKKYMANQSHILPLPIGEETRENIRHVKVKLYMALLFGR